MQILCISRKFHWTFFECLIYENLFSMSNSKNLAHTEFFLWKNLEAFIIIMKRWWNIIEVSQWQKLKGGAQSSLFNRILNGFNFELMKKIYEELLEFKLRVWMKNV